MTKHWHRSELLLAIAVLAISSLPALATGGPLNVRGTITSINGNNLAIKENNGSSATVHLTDNAAVVSVAKANVSDIKPGSYIGTAATPRTDGTLQAIEIHIFPASMRGSGEGNRTWDLKPKSSMTNGTVAPSHGRVANNKVNKVEGDKITVDYNGGSKVVDITPSTKVVSLVPGNRSELKPGAPVVIVGATKNSDGSLQTNRVTVGTKNLAPPM